MKPKNKTTKYTVRKIKTTDFYSHGSNFLGITFRRGDKD